MPSPDLVRLKLFSDGTEVPGTAGVHAVEVMLAFDRLPAATVTLHDGDAAAQDFGLSNGDLFACGRRLEIRAGYHDREDTLFDGLVVKHAVRARPGGRTTLTLECRHAAVKATLEKKSAVFFDVTDSDLIGQLLQAHGLTAEVSSTAVQHRQLVQAHATDWDFVLHRAQANGLLVRAARDKVVIAAPDTSAEPVLRMTFGNDLFELEAESDARLQPAEVQASTWSAADQALAGATGADPGFAPPGNQAAAQLAEGVGSPKLQLRHGGRLPAPELQAWSDARALRHRMALVRGRLVCQGDAKLEPGVLAEIVGAGRRFSGKVFVTGVRHQISQENWQCDVQFGLDPRPLGGEALVPETSGLHVGVVTALEGDPDGEERIRVRLPIVDAQGDGVWARLSALDAGQGRGGVFRPELDDEVVVGFVAGDPREPVVLGKLFSSAKAAPIAASDDNHQKGFVTRSELKLVFDDEKKSVTVSTPAGKSFVLSEDPNEIVLKDEHGNQLKLSSDGITLETQGALSLKAAGDASLEGMNTSVKANGSLTASGNSGAEVTSSGVSKLKGTMVQIN